jgi:glycerophosphoryl diester phosphodiesterase
MIHVTFRGTSVEGRRMVGPDRLTHNIPARPAVRAPAKDAVVDAAANLVVRWEPVTRPRGIRIVRYIVIVTEEGSEREPSMDLEPGATSATITPGFLVRGRDYAVEVIARERSGNQTITRSRSGQADNREGMRHPLIVASLTVAVLACSALPADAQNRWVQKRAPLNMADQGGEDEFPSGTMYAFRKALRAGADMLALDVGVTQDDRVVVMRDTTLDRTTNGRGPVAWRTLRQVKRLDAAYWFAPRAEEHYNHKLPRRAYRFRGIATGRRKPPKGFRAGDFRVPTLTEVLNAFPRTPISIEIKGRTGAAAPEEHVLNAEMLARPLRRTARRDLIVFSFQQAAVDRFHQLLPEIDIAPGFIGASDWFRGGSPGEGVVALQMPIIFRYAGTPIEVTTADNVARAHREGYAWQSWFSADDRDDPASWGRLIDVCVDGITTARPRALEQVLSAHQRPATCR